MPETWIVPLVGCWRPTRRTPDGRLARAGLADQTEHLSLAHLERHVVDGAEGRLAEASGELDDEVVDLEHELVLVDQARTVLAAQVRDGVEQRAGVGVRGSANSSARRRLLDDVAAIHHDDPVGHVGDDAHVVGDQHDRRAEPVAQSTAGARGSRPAP